MAKKNAGNPPVTARDEFSQATRELLARRAGFRCSICQAPTTGPHSTAQQAVYLGEASHIYSAAPNGPRDDPSLSAEERASPSNGIHLCKIHARHIDVEVSTYPPQKLIEMKLAHEQTIRALLVGPSADFDPDFLTSHEIQIIHGRGHPKLTDLWVKRHLVRPQVDAAPAKCDAISLLSGESGMQIISGDQSSGRTSLLKYLATNSLQRKNCVWIDGRRLTETAIRDPVRLLAAGYKALNANVDGWESFLQSPQSDNLILIDDLHLSPLNLATTRRLLSLLQGLAGLVIVTVNPPFFIEFLAFQSNIEVRSNHWELLDLSRADCSELVKLWCTFRSESIPDQELDVRVASTQDQLEILFGRKLMPRLPFFILTALQLIDAGSPMDTSVGSFGGVYEAVIHLALCKDAPNQAAITSERAYLEELAYWCESQPDSPHRQAFNQWFADRKAILLKRVEELEMSLSIKGFISRRHQGFRFNYQRYYFLASFLRDNPNRVGVDEYISKLIANCWNEDYANTALFLAYLQPSSRLINALLAEARRLFQNHSEFELGSWKIDSTFHPGFFRGLTFTRDPESNRRLLAERLDAENPVSSAECESGTSTVLPDVNGDPFLDFLRGFHVIKLIGQLIRNSPIALDAEQKRDMVCAGFDLSLRLISFMGEICSPAAVQAHAVNELRTRVLKKSDRFQLEAQLTGLTYNLTLFLTLT